MTKNAVRTTALLMLCAASAPYHTALADGYTGEKTLGIQAGYTSYNESAMAGIEFTYRFNRNFRLAPNVEYVFRHKEVDALLININAQFPIPFAQRWEVYPLVGVNYSSWNYHPADRSPIDRGDVSDRDSRFGLNAGGGIRVNATQSLSLGVTADYVIIKHFHGCNIRATIAYQF